MPKKEKVSSIYQRRKKPRAGAPEQKEYEEKRFNGDWSLIVTREDEVFQEKPGNRMESRFGKRLAKEKENDANPGKKKSTQEKEVANPATYKSTKEVTTQKRRLAQKGKKKIVVHAHSDHFGGGESKTTGGRVREHAIYGRVKVMCKRALRG